MNSNTVRKTFFKFFESKQHKIVPSAPMVIKNDPTLMFTNAGMNQFKDIFLGNATPPDVRLANTQKCLRVSGKHNDLDEVGHDTYHHTMFEMLGNWSFGNYFKKEAIDWAWELITEVYKIDKDNLYVTVFGGDKKDGIEDDKEAYSYWKNHISEDQILYGSKKDNFWEMGETGPCGPCSEIHIDLREKEEKRMIPGKDLVNMDHPEVIEIWNLVFIEFNRKGDNSLVNLPSKHVDTGMGFERLCMVLQNKKSNYDTDIFQDTISQLADISQIKYGSSEESDIAMRVISDHLRAVVFSIADGQLPSNIKAGYVIRRILRRAVRYAYTFLDLKDPFIFELVPSVVAKLGSVFPEISSQQELIQKVIKEEEISFLRTLETGIKKFEQYVNTKSGDKIIEGNVAFELFDTYGFPVDLTQLMANERGWKVDMDGFNEGLNKQKARSRMAAEKDLEDWVVLMDGISNSEFVGYDNLEVDCRIVKYRKIKDKKREYYQIVLDKTPFYAESGGQVGDRGYIFNDEDKLFIEDTQKENELPVHFISKLPANPTVSFHAVVDSEKRLMTMNNHSATHLMHAALRKVLGSHVEQKGSLVDENRLRFDFTHFSKVTEEEIIQIEKIVNAKIRENILIDVKSGVPIEKALEMGAVALFGEKYGEEVRVITFDSDYSVELCGGTHVPATGQIGLFKIISEGAIAAGIRRVEAVTAVKSEEFVYEQEKVMRELKTIFKAQKDLVKGVNQLMLDNSELKQKVDFLNREKAMMVKGSLIEKLENIDGVNFIASKVDLEMGAIRDLAFNIGKEIDDLFLVLGSSAGGKANITILISETLVKNKNLNAGSIIRDVAREIKGGGGGQPHFATAGGKDPSGLSNAFEKARKLLKAELNV